MLDQLSEKFEEILKKLRGTGVLTEQNIAEALKEVRLALLEADVNFKVARDFIDRVKAKSVGVEVVQSIQPGQQIVLAQIRFQPFRKPRACVTIGLGQHLRATGALPILQRIKCQP